MFTRLMANASPEKQGEILNKVAQHIDDGKIKPRVTKRLSWKDVKTAHEMQEGFSMLGKIAMEID